MSLLATLGCALFFFHGLAARYTSSSMDPNFLQSSHLVLNTAIIFISPDQSHPNKLRAQRSATHVSGWGFSSAASVPAALAAFSLFPLQQTQTWFCKNQGCQCGGMNPGSTSRTSPHRRSLLRQQQTISVHLWQCWRNALCFGC